MIDTANKLSFKYFNPSFSRNKLMMLIFHSTWKIHRIECFLNFSASRQANVCY